MSCSTVEGATFVEDGIEPLARAYEQGVRSVQLVHYIENPLGDFQTEAPQHDGLTELGRAGDRRSAIASASSSTSPTAPTRRAPGAGSVNAAA